MKIRKIYLKIAALIGAMITVLVTILAVPVAAYNTQSEIVGSYAPSFTSVQWGPSFFEYDLSYADSTNGIQGTQYTGSFQDNDIVLMFEREIRGYLDTSTVFPNVQNIQFEFSNATFWIYRIQNDESHSAFRYDGPIQVHINYNCQYAYDSIIPYKSAIVRIQAGTRQYVKFFNGGGIQDTKYGCRNTSWWCVDTLDPSYTVNDTGVNIGFITPRDQNETNVNYTAYSYTGISDEAITNNSDYHKAAVNSRFEGISLINNKTFWQAYDWAEKIGKGIGYTEGYTDGAAEAYTPAYEDGLAVGKEEGYTKGYTAGKTEGYTEGYTEGKKDGHSDGYNLGYHNGNTDGWESGYSEGYNVGLAQAYTSGYDNGYADGHPAGYEEGHAAGFDEGYLKGENVGEQKALKQGKVFKDGVFAIFEAPALLIESMLNFDLFDINLFSLFKTLLTVGVVGVIVVVLIKFIKG